MKSKTVSPIMGERDPAIVRQFPFLSRERRRALARVNHAIEVDRERINKSIGIRDDTPIGKVIRAYSTRTLNLVADAFEEVGHLGIISFFEMDASRTRYVHEMALRAILSYRMVLEECINDSVLGAGHRPRSQRSVLEQVVRHAGTFHTDFLRHEDTSVLRGETRARYEAIIIVLLSVDDVLDFDYRDGMSMPLAELAMSRPDRAHDIARYRKERGMLLSEVHPDAVTEYLDNPAPALNIGIL